MAARTGDCRKNRSIRGSKRIDDTVASLGIEKLMDRSIFHLSDGEKQKIACSGVNVSGPDLILLDEPSANLDFEATMALRNMILSWRSKGKTIIAAEHRIAYGRIARQFTRNELSVLTPEDLAQMGLRTNIMEAPEKSLLPVYQENDEPMILHDFNFSYRGRKQPVLQIPHLRLAAHEITAVTGNNGLGKTTFLSCLCGLEKRFRGTLEYKGRNYSNRDRQKLCYLVMQDTGNQLFTESVLEEVLISLPKNTENAEGRAAELLRRLDLGEYPDRHPQSLSGGQKQRLAIACALASGREILLLDEPTSGLDYGHMKETADMLKKLRDMGTTVLVVTHDTELIRHCCSRMISESSFQ